MDLNLEKTGGGDCGVGPTFYSENNNMNPYPFLHLYFPQIKF